MQPLEEIARGSDRPQHLAMLVCLMLVAACGGDTIDDPIAPTAAASLQAIELEPDRGSLRPGATQQFIVSGDWDDGSDAPVAVRWSASGGEIDPTGFYHAGSTPGTYRVIASGAASRLADTAVVTVSAMAPTPPTAVAAAVLGQFLLRPVDLVLAPGESHRFKTFVRTSDGWLRLRTGVVYTATGGTIDTAGIYVAGLDAGTYQVRATIEGGETLTSSVTIGSVPPPTLPVPEPVPPLSEAGSCLLQSGPLTTLAGVQQRYDARTSAVPNNRIDARRATWVGAGSFPVLVADQDNPVPGLCWVGGLIQSGKPAGTEWREYHSTAGMWLASPGFVVEGVRIEEYGDAIRAVMHADHWTVKGIHVVNAHDDCMENDWLHNGRIEDMLYEGCYVFLSSRPGSGVQGSGIPVSAAGDTVRISQSLVWLKPMPSVYRGPVPGTGPLFKWSPEAQALAVVITNSIFRVDQAPNHGDLNLPPTLPGCANNTIVWLGSGPYPARLPACFRVTTDKGVWDRAVAEWKARHSES